MDTKTFSVLDAIKGRSYPTDEVEVYLDVESLYEYIRINDLANDAKDSDTVNALDAELNVLREKIMATRLTFHMRGFAPKVSKAILAEARAKFSLDGDEMILEDTPAFRWVNLRTIAESVIKVENVAGEVDEKHFSTEDIEAFEDMLLPEEFAKISEKTFELSFKAMMFDAAVTPDF